LRYTKTPFTVDQHIELLKTRGLVIEDYDRAKRYISNIGYFRLSGYMYHLQSTDGNHSFKEGTTFNDIILHYQFDKKLRAILLEYLERIEIALRARITDKFSNSVDFYWYTDKSLFDDMAIYNSINAEIIEHYKAPQERFLKAFKNKYTSESLPPSNMALEILTLGKLSRLFRGLKNKNEKVQIAEDFGLPSTVLSSWLVYLTNVRNICAHHSRLWNRKVTADRPMIPSRKKYQFKGDIPTDFNTTVYGIVAMIDRILNAINPSNHFIDRLIHLIDDYSNINTTLMGFPEDWRSNPAWA
jgi:abortive infection bacteriophage resistance protein